MELVDKLGYDVSEAQAIVLGFLLDIPPDQMSSGEIVVDRAVFLSVLRDNGIDSLSKLKAKIKNGPGNVFWLAFYEYGFKMSRESTTHKYIDLEGAIGLLPLVYEMASSGEYPQYTKFVAYLTHLKEAADKAPDKKAPHVSEDTWSQLPKFLSQFKDDKFASYDPMEPWPVQIDEMVEWVQES